jgi:hypothetical protein
MLLQPVPVLFQRFRIVPGRFPATEHDKGSVIIAAYKRGSSNHRTKILKANYALGKLSQAVDTSVTVQFGSATALDFGRPGFAPRLRGGPPITARSRLMA